MHQSTTQIVFFLFVLFILCLNRLSVTKNMLLVPKYFVTVPDNVPEILINLSHP